MLWNGMEWNVEKKLGVHYQRNHLRYRLQQTQKQSENVEYFRRKTANVECFNSL